MTSSLPDRAHALVSLSDPAAPRVLSPTDLVNWLKGRDIVVLLPNATRMLREWSAAGLVEQLRRGVYLNLRAHPAPTPDEAAGVLRHGAVISLQRVLGQAGVLNNPTDWITAVLPLEQSRGVGTLSAGRHTFQFVGMRQDLFLSSTDANAADVYQPYSAAVTATPEKALLDWIYLAKASPLWRLPPHQDIDEDYLDIEKLNRVAVRMGLEEDVTNFLAGHPVSPKATRRRRGP